MTVLEKKVEEIEKILDSLASKGSGLLMEPLEKSDQPYSGPCAVCGKTFTTELDSFTTGKGEILYCWKHELWAQHHELKWGNQRWYLWPVCSEECKLMGQRMLKCISQRRMEQWQTIRVARQVLKEARSWLRNREVSQSQSGESIPPVSSPR